MEENKKEEKKELRKESEYNKYGYGNCGMCGGALVWQSDYDFEDFGYEGEGIVSIAVCSHCGAEVETRLRTDNPDEEE